MYYILYIGYCDDVYCGAVCLHIIYHKIIPTSDNQYYYHHYYIDLDKYIYLDSRYLLLLIINENLIKYLVILDFLSIKTKSGLLARLPIALHNVLMLLF